MDQFVRHLIDSDKQITLDDLVCLTLRGYSISISESVPAMDGVTLRVQKGEYECGVVLSRQQLALSRAVLPDIEFRKQLAEF